jgi:hypothetical protein
LQKGDVTVTTMDAAAARRWHHRVALAVLLALAGVSVAGCESGGSLFSGSPFGGSLFGSTTPEPEIAAPSPATPQPPLAKVAVTPVIGAPDAVAKLIQQEFTSAVERQRVSVTANKDERADYTLRGYIVAAKDKKAKTATKVSYIWDVTDPSGKRVNRITGEEVVAGNASKDPWAAVTPQVAQSIASKAAGSLVAWLPTASGQAPAVATNPAQPASVGAQPAVAAAAPAPTAAKRPAAAAKARPTATASAPAAAASPTTGSIARDGPVMAVVPAVTGAPGDGSASLTAAIQRELAGKGVALADKPTTTAYRVEGTVTIGEAKQGKQPIHIEWLVRDPQGKKLGTVSQRNEIPEGSLDGQWGATATQAAGAAAQGIVKLLPQAKATN